MFKLTKRKDKNKIKEFINNLDQKSDSYIIQAYQFLDTSSLLGHKSKDTLDHMRAVKKELTSRGLYKRDY